MKAAPLGKEGLCPGPRRTVEGFPSPFPRGRAKGGQAKGLLEGTESHLQNWTQKDWGAIRPKKQEEGNCDSPGPHPPHVKRRTYPNIPSTKGPSSSPATRVGSGAKRSQGISSRPCSVTKQLQDCWLQASAPLAAEWCPLPPRCDGEIKSTEEYARG